VTLVFHPLAARELIAAAKFYETRAPGLGADFIQQIEHTLEDVVAHPNAGSLFAGTTIRRRLIQRFPFAVVYEFESENISVIAIMHLRAPAGLLEATPSTESQARRWNSRV
jgi:plasmid stabilization system protein ParE